MKIKYNVMEIHYVTVFMIKIYHESLKKGYIKLAMTFYKKDDRRLLGNLTTLPDINTHIAVFERIQNNIVRGKVVKDRITNTVSEAGTEIILGYLKEYCDFPELEQIY